MYINIILTIKRSGRVSPRKMTCRSHTKNRAIANITKATKITNIHQGKSSLLKYYNTVQISGYIQIIKSRVCSLSEITVL